jgi:hypothetical protein
LDSQHQFNTEIKDDYDLCINQPLEYQRKLDNISDSLRLKGDSRLRADNTPMYNVGRLDSQYVMFTLNPGYDIDDITVNQEEVDARKGWEEYQIYCVEFYKRKYCPDSRFYKTNGRLLCGLTGMKDDWICFDANLLTLELIPYHSIAMNGLAFSEYLNDRFHSMLEIAKTSRRKLLIFNGKIFHTLLIHNQFINKDTLQIKIIKKFGMYLFEIDTIPCILFDKFLVAGHFEGLTNDHLYTTIPNLIRQKYGEIGFMSRCIKY